MTRLAPSVWRLARAVARREWRVIVAVGLFVAVTAAGAAAILSRSSVQVVSPERVRAAFAGGADMVVSENPGSIISMGSQVGPRGGCCPGPGLSNAAALRDHLDLPRGTRSLTADIVGVQVVRPTDDRSSGMLTLTQMDLSDPLARGMSAVRAGRLPMRAGEVALTVPLVEQSQRPGTDPAADTWGPVAREVQRTVGVGDRIELVGVGAVSVVGRVAVPVATDLVGFPSALIAAPGTVPLPGSSTAAAGSLVQSRDAFVLLRLPLASDWEPSDRWGYRTGIRTLSGAPMSPEDVSDPAATWQLRAAAIGSSPGWQQGLALAGGALVLVASGAGAALMARRTERERRILALSGASADVGTRLLWRVGFAVVAPAAVALPLAVWATRPTARVDPIVAATGDGWTVALVAAIVLIAIATVVASVFASYTRADRSSSLGSLAVMAVLAALVAFVVEGLIPQSLGGVTSRGRSMLVALVAVVAALGAQWVLRRALLRHRPRGAALLSGDGGRLRATVPGASAAVLLAMAMCATTVLGAAWDATDATGQPASTAQAENSGVAGSHRVAVSTGVAFGWSRSGIDVSEIGRAYRSGFPLVGVGGAAQLCLTNLTAVAPTAGSVGEADGRGSTCLTADLVMVDPAAFDRLPPEFGSALKAGSPVPYYSGPMSAEPEGLTWSVAGSGDPPAPLGVIRPAITPTQAGNELINVVGSGPAVLIAGPEASASGGSYEFAALPVPVSWLGADPARSTAADVARRSAALLRRLGWTRETIGLSTPSASSDPEPSGASWWLVAAIAAVGAFVAAVSLWLAGVEQRPRRRVLRLQGASDAQLRRADVAAAFMLVGPAFVASMAVPALGLALGGQGLFLRSQRIIPTVAIVLACFTAALLAGQWWGGRGERRADLDRREAAELASTPIRL